MPKWSDIRALQFLDIYERYECLWNPRTEDYKSKSSRNAAFDSMLAELKVPDLTANDIKLKIKSIRTTYKRELSAVLKAEANMQNGGPAYKPKLFWFNRADKFLRSVSTSRYSTVLMRESQSNCEQQYAQPESAKYRPESVKYQPEHVIKKFKQEALHEMTMGLESDVDDQSIVEEDMKGRIMHHDDNIEHEEHVVEEAVESMSEQEQHETIPIETIREETITVAPYRHNESYEQTSTNTTTTTIHEIEPASSSMTRNSSNNHEENEYKLFCKSVEAQLRSIPDAYSRSVAKFKIQQVLFEAETGHYRKTTYVTIPTVNP